MRALIASITDRLYRLSHDELLVLDHVLDGLEQGRKRYGELDLQRDDRDWTDEAAAELRDAFVYFAAREIAARKRGSTK